MTFSRRNFLKKSLVISGTALLAPKSLSAANKPAKNLLNAKKILFLGDSITQQGHYVNWIEAYLRIHYPMAGREIINLGLSSETASGLSEPTHPFPRPGIHSRLDTIIDYVQPDLTVAGYGINDAIYHPLSESRFKAYQEGILKLSEKIKASGSELILLTPAPYTAPIQDPNSFQGEYGYASPYVYYDEVMKVYAEWLKIQNSANFQVIDIQPALRKYQQVCYGNDFIHPNQYGHYLMASTILNKAGFDTAPQVNTFNCDDQKNLDFYTNYKPIVKPIPSRDVNFNANILDQWNQQQLKFENLENSVYQVYQDFKLMHQFQNRENVQLLNIHPNTFSSNYRWLDQYQKGEKIMAILNSKHENFDFALMHHLGHERPFGKTALPLSEAIKFKNELETKITGLLSENSQQWNLILIP